MTAVQRPDNLNNCHMSQPLVTAVITTYNQAAYLGEAIQSVVNQTYQPLEIIVIDNDSSDATAEIVAEFPSTKYIKQENSGPSGARNRGIKEANGEFIVFLDGDDRVRADCVEARVKLLLNAPSANLVVGAYDVVNSQGELLFHDSIAPAERTTTTFWQAVQEMRCPTCGLVARTSALREIGGFDEQLRIAEDSDLLIRMSAISDALIDHDFRADYRQVPGSISRDYLLWFDSYSRMLSKNVAATTDVKRYRKESKKSLANLCNIQLFSKIIKDPTVTQKAVVLLKLMAGRPILIAFGLRYAWLHLGKMLKRKKKQS